MGTSKKPAYKASAPLKFEDNKISAKHSAINTCSVVYVQCSAYSRSSNILITGIVYDDAKKKRPRNEAGGNDPEYRLL